MNKKEYLEKLDFNLNLPKEYVKDILKEVSVHIDEYDDPNVDILKNLGKPEKMADKMNASKPLSFLSLLKLISTYELMAKGFIAFFALNTVLFVSLNVFLGLLNIKSLSAPFGLVSFVIIEILVFLGIRIFLDKEKCKKQIYVAIYSPLLSLFFSVFLLLFSQPFF